MQRLSEARKLEKDEVNLQVGNGVRVAILAMGTYFLSLPLGLTLELRNS